MISVDRIVLKSDTTEKTVDEDINYSIRKIKVYDLTDVYLTFLLYFYEDFDDDLLQDALEILNI